jgi:hypothetical protein
MNTNGLAKLYSVLTPKERLPLIMAAVERGDDVEADRLARSAPDKVFCLPDYFGLADAVIHASLLHLAELLNLAALFWHVEGMLAEWEVLDEESDLSKRLRGTAGAFAYLFTVKLDGWRRFCSELRVDPELLMNDLPGFGVVKRTEDAARIVACTPAEAIEWLRQQGNESDETVESVATDLTTFVNSWAERWE